MKFHPKGEGGKTAKAEDQPHASIARSIIQGATQSVSACPSPEKLLRLFWVIL